MSASRRLFRRALTEKGLKPIREADSDSFFGASLFRRALTEKGLKLSTSSYSGYPHVLFRRALTEKGLKLLNHTAFP